MPSRRVRATDFAGSGAKFPWLRPWASELPGHRGSAWRHDKRSARPAAGPLRWHFMRVGWRQANQRMGCSVRRAYKSDPGVRLRIALLAPTIVAGRPECILSFKQCPIGVHIMIPKRVLTIVFASAIAIFGPQRECEPQHPVGTTIG
jgi:hypothetical protein